MKRRQVVALVLTAGLVAGALVLRAGGAGDSPNDLAGAAELAPLRRAAALEPCTGPLGLGLPALTLPCLGDGTGRAVVGAPGRPQLVNVWATWCAPCVREVPIFVRFAQKAGERVGVVGVLLQDTPENGLEFARQYGMRYPSVVDDDGRILRTYGRLPPITLLVDAQGVVRHVERGQVDSLAELEQIVASKLGVKL